MSRETMRPRDVVARAIGGLPAPRWAAGPLAVHFCARRAGKTLREYTLDARALAESVIRYFEDFRPDAVWISADTWVSAEAMGAPVAFPEGDQPLGGTGEPLVRTAADLDRIPRPDPSSRGRCPIMLEALARVVAAVGSEAFVVACFDQYPFSLACALLGLDAAMLRVSEDRRFLESAMERCLEYAVSYGKALAEAGADALSGGDSPAGLLGPERYREVALPFETRVVSELRAATGKPVSLHVCGDTRPILEDMASSGADVLELDYPVGLAEAARRLGPEVAIWGNLDPVAVLSRGAPSDVRRASLAAIEDVRAARHTRFVLSSGCTLAVETPAENVRALIEAAREAPPPM